jgi:lysozyme family protein
MWGVTKKVAEAHAYRGPMKDLPVEIARAIYRKSYWDKVRADDLPPTLRYAVFDAAVNSGHVRAIQWLQQAIDVPADGIFGPQTLNKLLPMNAFSVKCKMLGYRLDFMASLSTWNSFGRGWSRRIASLLQK